MEILRRRNGSGCGDAFSFPSTPAKDSDIGSEFEFEFEFGSSATPDSPSSGGMSKSSPADHLFANGILLPHKFPCQNPNTPPSAVNNIYSRPIMTPTRTSSVSSKDSYYSSYSSSLMSSRSNSVNSSRSCSSARTSYSSDGSSERRKLRAMRTRSMRERYNNNNNNNNNHNNISNSKDVVAKVYGSQRWQFIAPMPVLSRETSISRRKKKGDEKNNNNNNMIIREDQAININSKPGSKDHRGRGFCRKLFDSFMSTCRQCHAMEAQVNDDQVLVYGCA